MGNLMIAQVEQERLKQCVEKQQQVQLFFFAWGNYGVFFLTLQYGFQNAGGVFFWAMFC